MEWTLLIMVPLLCLSAFCGKALIEEKQTIHGNMERTRRDMVHGKACMEGCMFPYQERVSKSITIPSASKVECKCKGMDMEHT